MGCFAVVVQQKASNKGATLGESDDGVIRPVLLNVVDQPFMCTPNGIYRCLGPPSIMPRVKEDLDARCWCAVEWGIHEVKRVRFRELCPEGHWWISSRVNKWSSSGGRFFFFFLVSYEPVCDFMIDALVPCPWSPRTLILSSLLGRWLNKE